MQTFFNPTTPFFDDEGHPLVGARVSFLEIGTSANLIDVTDSEGTPLPKPERITVKLPRRERLPWTV